MQGINRTVIHGIWFSGRLRLWAEDGAAARETWSASAPQEGPVTVGLPTHPFAAGAEALRPILEEHWGQQAEAAGRESSVALRLPSAGERPQPSTELKEVLPQEPVAYHLLRWSLPCLEYGPADALTLLTKPTSADEDVMPADSLRFWQRLAELLVRLLSTQRFLPDIATDVEGRCWARWQPVLDGMGQSKQLASWIACMPPVCRSGSEDPAGWEARELVEDFFSAVLDAAVRRGLMEDPLTEALDQPGGPEMPWLRALTGTDARVKPVDGAATDLITNVRSWIGRLEDITAHAAFRTCFKLQTPELPDDTTSTDDEGEWTVSFHLQAVDDPYVLLDADRVWSLRGGSPVLRGQYQRLRKQLEDDLRRAASFFPALQDLVDAERPTACALDTDGAYTFLKEWAPVLEMNGFGVVIPEWCRSGGPHFGLRLHLRPRGDGIASAARMGLESLVEYRWQVALGDEVLTEEEFKKLCNVSRPLVQFRGRWIRTKPSAMREALRFLQSGQSGETTLFEALRMSIGRGPRMGLPVTELDASGWLEAALEQLPEGQDATQRTAQPATFRGQLRPYQLTGLGWLVFLDRFRLGGCLADDMGLGKTIQFIALAQHERMGGANPGPTLLVVPMSLVGNWWRELGRFAPELRVMVHHGPERLTGRSFIEEARMHDVVISTYALAHRDAEHLSEVEWYRVVLDEAQNIKNPAAKQTAAIRGLRAKHRLALTGTPLENHLTELWSIMEFLNPGLLGGASDFRRYFAMPIEKHHDAERGEQLRRLIRPFILRRTKDDPAVADELPEKMEMKVFCNLSREQAALYQSTLDQMLGDIDSATGVRRRGLVLATLTRLKQICNHPAAGQADEVELSDLRGRSGKCERLGEMLEEVLAEGERALVFTQFRKMGDLLERLLRDRLGYEMLFLHGGTTAPRRTEMVDRFQSNDPKVPVFLLSLKAGGFGLNLTSATHVFHFDRWWNPAVEDQATDRVHRIGQTRRVQIHKFVCLGTLEERIDSMLTEKRDLAGRIIGSGEQWLTELSTDQLREVLALSQEAVVHG